MSKIIGFLIRRTLFIVLMVPCIGHAGITTDFELESGIIYSDNIERASQNKVSQSIARIRPSFTVNVEGNRSDIKGNIAADMLYFFESEQSRIDPQLFLKSETRLLEQHLFLDAGIRYARINVDSDRTNADNLNTIEEVTDSVQFQISPYFLYKFGTYANLDARLTHSRFVVPDNKESGFVGNGASFFLNRAHERNSVYWALGSAYRTIELRQTTQFTEANIVAETGYSIEQDLLLLLMVGRERISIDSKESSSAAIVGEDAGSDISSSDTIWEAGAVWKPNSRTSLEARYGERGFGRKPSVKAELRGRRSVVALTWTRQYTTSRQQLSDLEALSVDVSESDTEEVGSAFDEPLSAFESIAVDETIGLSYEINGRRTDVSFEVLNSRRVSVGNSFTDETTQFRSTLVRQLSKKLGASVEYLYSTGTVGEDDAKFEENRIALSVKYSF